MEYLSLRKCPELRIKAAEWFHSKWSIPAEAYLECIDAYISGESELGLYLCVDEEDIIGGLGVIENDFHERRDLSPNICAVYVETPYQRRGIARTLLNSAVEDMRSHGICQRFIL